MKFFDRYSAAVQGPSAALHPDIFPERRSIEFNNHRWSLFLIGFCMIVAWGPQAGAAQAEALETEDGISPPSIAVQGSLYAVKSETVRVVTAYNVGDPRQTDDTPCIAANGQNICRALLQGKNHCAANFVPLGTLIHIDKVGHCRVTDRTNRRYRNRVDIAMLRHEYKKARRFGRQKLHVKILRPILPAASLAYEQK